MKLSVVVPCLVRDAGVEKCLGEIRRQSAAGGAELELVVVEGVSPCGKARNEGLRQATGDYLAWVDADDEILEGWWAELVAALAGKPDVVVFGWHDDCRGCDDGPQATACATGETLLRAVLRDASPFSFLWNKVIRRTLWDGARFDENLRLMTDFDLLPQVLENAQRIVTIDRVLYRYHYSGGSVCRRDLPGKEAEVLEIGWHRVERWRETPFAADAWPFFALKISERYTRVASASGKLADDDLLQRQLARVAGNWGLVLSSGGLRMQDRLKVLFAKLGWAWPQRVLGRRV